MRFSAIMSVFLSVLLTWRSCLRSRADLQLEADRENAKDLGMSRVGRSRQSLSGRNTISSNPMPRSAFSFSFFESSQVKYFTDRSVAEIVPLLKRSPGSVTWLAQ